MKEDNNISSSHLKKLIPAGEIKSAVHDLNNLMNYIINGIEIIDDNSTTDSKTKSILGNIKKNSKLASSILLQLSSSWSSSVNYKSTIRLNSLLKDAISAFRNNADNGINITLNTLESDDKITANKTELERAILNLITNAQEAESENITITLSSDPSKSDKYLVIEVSDDGKGISKHLLNNLFQQGYSSKENKQLHGFGLSIVKKIVDNHSGRIEVESEINTGTTFKMYLPKNPVKHNLDKLKNKTVLLVEDDQFQREVLKDLLQSLKISVLTANDGYEAIETSKRTKIDLVIIDKIMPNMDGEECINELKKMGFTFPFILTSGSDIDNSLKSDISKVLKKPYNFEMIQSALIELLV